MLSKYSVKRPFTVVVAVIAIIVLGVVSFINTSVDLLPSMELPYVVVYTTYVGASPEKVETALTTPLESSLATTSGLENISSISSENLSLVILEFSYSTNMDSAMIEMNAAIDMIKPYLEDGVGTPTLMRIDPDMLPVVISSVDYDGMESAELSSFVNDTVIPALKRLDGVASVSGNGLVENSISITLRGEKIDKLNEQIAEELEKKFDDTEAMLNNALGQLNQAQSTIDEQRQQFLSSKDQIAEGKAQLLQAQTALNEQLEQLNQAKAGYQLQISSLQQLIDEREAQSYTADTDETLAGYYAKLTEAQTGLNAVEQGITTIQSQLDVTKLKLQELEAAEDKITASEPTVNEQLSAAEQQLSDAKTTLYSKMSEFHTAREDALEQADVKQYITSSMIGGILTADNFSMPAGYIDIDGEPQIVKVGEKFVSLDEISALELMDMGLDTVGKITLSDVADIEMVDNAGESYAHINGNDGIILSIEKQSTYSTVEVAKRVGEACDKLCADNEGLHITPLSDQGEYINIVVKSVLQNLLMGGLLAILVLLIFLRNVRPTLIIAVSIPVSLMFAVVLMYFSGVTMNLISLAGLALGVGMLVDNSIVVIENTFRLRSEGADAHTAAVKGATQVAGAVTASTLTTICVFLPIVFTQGLSRQLFTDMGLTIAYSLVASLIVALTVVPAMSQPMLRNYKEKRTPIFDAMANGYKKLLGATLKVKPIVIMIAVALLAIAAYGAFTSGLVFMPESDALQISATMETEGDYTTEEIREMANTVSDRICEIDGVEAVGAMEGSSISILGGGGSNSTSISMYIILDEKRSATSSEISKQIEECAPDLDCEITASGNSMDISALTGTGISVNVKGTDNDSMTKAARDIAAMLQKTEGTMEVTDLDAKSNSELRVNIDKNTALGYGLTVAQVYMDIADRLAASSSVTTVTIDSVDYPITVYDDSVEALDFDSLSGYIVGSYTNDDGDEQDIALSDIATIEMSQSLGSIYHSNQTKYITVSAAIEDGYNVSLVSRDFESKLADYDPPAGVSIALDGENENIMDTLNDLLIMIGLACVLIYLIMVAQFQSLLSPFIVIFTIPLAFTGGLLALMLCNMEISIISMLGFLVLAGVVVNNGIVLVDYINQLREQGVPKREAIIEAGKTRMRPILMTAITTILGLSTLALAIGTGADLLQPLAVVVIGGLVYATFMTLFVVPAMYDIFNREKKQRRGKKQPAPALAEGAQPAAIASAQTEDIAVSEEAQHIEECEAADNAELTEEAVITEDAD